MRKRKRFVAAAGIATVGALIATALVVVPALATPPSGASVTPLALVAQFDEIKANAKIGDWKAMIKTKGVSDLHVVQVTIQPGEPSVGIATQD